MSESIDNELRQLDALVAERVMGLQVLGVAACVRNPECGHVLDVLPSYERGGSWSEGHPVYVSECRCAFYPVTHVHYPEHLRHIELEANERNKREHEADVARWGHSHACLSVVPFYSSSIEAAKKVVEKLRERGVWTQIQTFTHTSQVRVEMGVPSSECQEWGATMEEAICRCALKAVAKFELLAERVAALKAVGD